VILRDYVDCGIPRLLRTIQHALDDPIEEKLAGIRMPALVVRGSRDTMVTQRWAEQVTRLLPNGRLIVVPGTPHTMNYSAAGLFVRAIAPFLTEARAAVSTSRGA
jgi:2-hydroxy-6-oxonona-2,4-dienedioate hydrolase